LISTCFAYGQNVNDWIDYDKTHYKFNVSETGVYRISHQVLSQTDIDLIGEHFQLFYKGEEIPIYISTEGAFAEGDYIEFYGEMNNGTFDTQLYEEPNHQIQNKTSLFTDKSAYYLTSNSLGNNKRFETTENDISNPPEKESYFMFESNEVYTDFFNRGALFFYDSFIYPASPAYSEGEGFVSSIVRNLYDEVDYNYDGIIDSIIYNTGVDFGLLTNNIYLESDENVKVQTRVVGLGSNEAPHFDLLSNKIEISIDSIAYVMDSFPNHQVQQYDFEVDINALANEVDILGDLWTKINFKAVDGIEPILGIEFRTKFTLGSLSIVYPRNFNFNDSKTFQFDLEIDAVKYFEIENFIGENNVVLYDLTDAKRIVPVYEADIHKFRINPTSNVNRKFILLNVNDDNASIRKVENLKEKIFTNYSDFSNQGNYIIVTNSILRGGSLDQIDRYETYRESELGGMHSVVAVDVEELYDQFAWGIDKHPMSIKNFVNFAMDNWENQPKFLNIIGRGIAYHYTRFDNDEKENCLVPTYGNTSSDFLFTTKSTQDYYTQLALGRIPARTNEDVMAYLDKVIEYDDQIYQTKSCDKIRDRAWMKNSIHIAKGRGFPETDEFKEYQDVYKKIFSKDCLGYSSVREFEDHLNGSPTDGPFFEQYSDEVKVHLESGVSFVNYFGQSMLKANDFSGGYDYYWQFDLRKPIEYNNKGKYPFVLSNASFVNNLNRKRDVYCIAEEYVLAKDRGAIGFLGPTNFPPFTLMHSFSKQLVQNFSTEFYGQSVGECLQKTKQQFYDASQFKTSLICDEYALAADPAIKLYQWEQPEYLIVEDSLKIYYDDQSDTVIINQVKANIYIQNW